MPGPVLLKSWPRPLSDDFHHPSQELPPTYEEVKREVERTGDIFVRVVTWNQQARETPPPEDLERNLFQSRRYHVIVVGTQECENTFAKSIVVPSKVKWEAALEKTLGSDYDAVHSHSLQASHIILFVHKALVHLVSAIKSLAVPTGLGDKLGNKGGIGIAMNIAESSFCFINAHLAAHQNATIRRINEFRKISNDVATKIFRRNSNNISSCHSTGDESEFIEFYDNDSRENCSGGAIATDSDSVGSVEQNEIDMINDDGIDENLKDPDRSDSNPLVNAFDFVFWFGDLNFRINGTREVVDGMLENHMHDALLCNDQLTMLLRFDRRFAGLSEGPLNFFPTYKFDHDSDHYDSSQKRRVPSWTDRILFKTDMNTQLLSYCSAGDVRTSDHRPVYATFQSTIRFDHTKEYVTPSWQTRRETRSEVCCIS